MKYKVNNDKNNRTTLDKIARYVRDKQKDENPLYILVDTNENRVDILDLEKFKDWGYNNFRYNNEQYIKTLLNKSLHILRYYENRYKQDKFNNLCKEIIYLLEKEVS